MTECIPARTLKGEIAKPIYGISIMRHAMNQAFGPRPNGLVIRHLCENDSTARNGFVCCNVDHMVYDTQKRNVADQLLKPENVETRRYWMRMNSNSAAGGKVSGKISCSIEYTCPICKKTGTGPSHLRYHGKNGEKCYVHIT